MDIFVLPEELMSFGAERQWVVHRGKVPFSPFEPYALARSNDSETWGMLREAEEALRTGNFDGAWF